MYIRTGGARFRELIFAGAIGASSAVVLAILWGKVKRSVGKISREGDGTKEGHIEKCCRDAQVEFNSAPTYRVPKQLLDGPGIADRTLRKAETILRHRTSRLIVVVERSTDSHNYSAIIRTCEALGVQNMWCIAPPSFDPTDMQKNSNLNPKKGKKRRKKDRWLDDQRELEQHAAYARGAMRWVDVRSFRTTAECVDEMRRQGYDIWVTDLSQEAECLRRSEAKGTLPVKLAICFGSESTGASVDLLRAADKRVYLPLWGFADSLNLSVAAALCIQRLFHIDPTIEGSMSSEERHNLRKKWYPKMARTVEKEKQYSKSAEKNQPAEPFADCRRANEHRKGWLKKKTQKKNAALGFKSWELQEEGST